MSTRLASLLLGTLMAVIGLGWAQAVVADDQDSIILGISIVDSSTATPSSTPTITPTTTPIGTSTPIATSTPGGSPSGAGNIVTGLPVTGASPNGIYWYAPIGLATVGLMLLGTSATVSVRRRH